jgi:hypothetical protein
MKLLKERLQAIELDPGPYIDDLLMFLSVKWPNLWVETVLNEDEHGNETEPALAILSERGNYGGTLWLVIEQWRGGWRAGDMTEDGRLLIYGPTLTEVVEKLSVEIRRTLGTEVVQKLSVTPPTAPETIVNGGSHLFGTPLTGAAEIRSAFVGATPRPTRTRALRDTLKHLWRP